MTADTQCCISFLTSYMYTNSNFNQNCYIWSRVQCFYNIPHLRFLFLPVFLLFWWGFSEQQAKQPNSRFILWVRWLFLTVEWFIGQCLVCHRSVWLNKQSKHSSENSEVQGPDWVKQQPLSKEKLWNVKVGNCISALAHWKQNRKKWGWLKSFAQKSLNDIKV